MSDKPSPPVALPIVAVVGATAAGKSRLALDLAEALAGEVVNTDAMQLYRGMDIGTAKLPPHQRRGIPHHLLDLLTVREGASVARFQVQGREVIGRLRADGATPVLVGGSALYARATLDHFEFPGTDETVRRRYESQLAEIGAPALHARLSAVDPASASRIIPENGRRVVRALEVLELTGRPFLASLPRQEYVEPLTVQLGVDLDRPTLDSRIEARVARMYDDGLVAEVERLLDEGLAEGPTAARAIGYRETIAHLRGELTLDQARERTAAATRRFVRRQDAWFRKDPRVVWVPGSDPLPLALEAIDALVSRHASEARP